MYNWLTILMIICWAVLAYFFVMVIYNKIKVHNVRMKMQEEGQISKKTNISMLTFWNIFFWMFPLTRYLNQGNEEHKKRAKKVNYSLLGMLIMMIILWILMVAFE